MVDSFIFDSKIHLMGNDENGRTFDERQDDILNVKMRQQGDSMVVRYDNSRGVHSTIRFCPDSIEFDRCCANNNMNFQEVISFDPNKRFEPLQGVTFQQIVFGWRNYDYRLEIKGSKPLYDPANSRLIIHQQENTNHSHCEIKII